MASETSFALPKPKPTRPCLSPMTISALKLNRRPPFTTLAQRLMKTSFSISSACNWPANAPVFTKAPFSGFSGSTGAAGARRARGVLERVSAAIMLEVESAFAGGIGKRFHFAVINVAAAVEDDFRDVLRLRAFGHEFANRDRRRGVGFWLR